MNKMRIRCQTWIHICQMSAMWWCGLFAISLLVQTSLSSASNSFRSNDLAHERLFQRIEKLAAEQHIESRRKCTHSSRERRQVDRLPWSNRFYETSSGISGDRGDLLFGMALYFTGQSDMLRRAGKNHLTAVAYPTEQFSVELWVKPEGGQKSPAVIVGFSDTCKSTPLNRDFGWSLGIRGSDQDPNKNARFYFSLHTDRSRQPTVVMSHRYYQPNTWVHLAATYDGRRMKLYLNGAMVASSFGQSGVIFNAVTQQCKQLVLGGSLLHDASYRGAMDELTIWSVSRGHDDIKNSMSSRRATNSGHSSNIIREDFDFTSNEERSRDWEAIGDHIPLLVHSDISTEMHNLSPTIPPCGITVCDNPTVMQSYIDRTALRKHKTLRYRVVSIANDDGSLPTVTHEQILRQHLEINEAFAPHNITWELSEMMVQNSSLRRRVVLHSCPSVSDIGNTECNEECNHEVTGHDGGDCESESEQQCNSSQIGDGRCDVNCNKAIYDWDDGDCCDPYVTNTSATCFDPASPLRNYMTVEELKDIVNSESNSHLNLFFVYFDDPSIEGFAIMPWETAALGILGGSVLQANCCNKPGSADSIIHELGHNLGLWHVHEGVSDMDCSDECWEKEPSLELGDLIADTNPTPENTECRDPRPCDNYATCGFEKEDYKETPFRNYMSYAGHECTDHFTFQQGARMHCYIDLFYSSWRGDKSSTSSIPLPPHIISERYSERLSDHSVTLAWVSPLNGLGVKNGSNLEEGGFPCGDCGEENILMQYASTAEAFGSKILREFLPERATGQPDAQSCSGSKYAWVAYDTQSCSECVLEVGFATPVIPGRLSIWVNYIGYGVKDIELHLTDGTTVSLGAVEVYCDIPFTTLLPGINGKLDKVRIHANRYLSIDSVLIESKPHHTDCQTCRYPYSVHRSPAFQTGNGIVTRLPYFVDRSVQPGVHYTYTIRTVLDEVKESDPSPPLHFHLGQSFCGDGRIDSESGEECDDKNVLDGDGCNLECRVEAYFNCSGKPSLCHRFVGDGICEDFERHYSVEDCGYYTPPGYRDQWAIGARANPDTKSCPASTVKGDPGPSQACHTSIDDVHKTHAWHPCGWDEHRTDYWLRVSFADPVVATAVIIHLGADGLYRNSGPKRVNVALIGPDGIQHSQPAKNVSVSCRDNPVHFNIEHDLSTPFYYTQEVYIEIYSYEVAISAVRLRSWKAFDPVEIRQCASGELYNPATEKCVHYNNCRKPRCGELRKKHAQVNCTGLLDGDICHVTCERGYTPQKTIIRQCINESWTGWDVKCKSVNCKRPEIAYATTNCPDGTTFGRECTFKCQSPAKLHGSSNRITCQADSMFSLPDSFCQLMCDSPPVLSHGELQTTSCMRAGPHIVGTSCKYLCAEGYHVAGDIQRKRALHYTCAATSSWEGPECVLIICPRPSPVFEDLYNCTNSYYLNSVCRLNCPSEEHNDQNLITCTSDGVWDRQFNMCPSLTGECQAPVSPDKNVTFTCSTNNLIGAVCTKSCKRGLYLLEKTPVVHVSGSDLSHAAEWQSSIVCTWQRRWYPDPSTLACVSACNEDYIGDDSCDGINNKAYCDWDGGDCCLSTCTNCELYVVPFPESCTDECQCFDPSAEENNRPHPPRP